MEELLSKVKIIKIKLKQFCLIESFQSAPEECFTALIIKPFLLKPSRSQCI